MAKQQQRPHPLWRESLPHTIGALGAGGVGVLAAWAWQRAPDVSPTWVALGISAVALTIAVVALFRK